MRSCVIALLAVFVPFVGLAEAYIDIHRPETLGATCERA